MVYNSEAEIYELVEAFEMRTLPKEKWDHAAHLTVGLYYSLKYAPPIAQKFMRRGICWLNCVHGTINSRTSGYHETLTLFWLDAIVEIIRTNPGKDLVELANTVLGLRGDPDLPLRAYSRERLFSPAAREGYLRPDLYYFRKAA
jgi:hypothetical protein